MLWVFSPVILEETGGLSEFPVLKNFLGCAAFGRCQVKSSEVAVVVVDVVDVVVDGEGDDNSFSFIISNSLCSPTFSSPAFMF